MLNKVPNAEVERYLREKLAGRGLAPAGILHEDPTVAAAWLRAVAYAGHERVASISPEAVVSPA